MTTRRAENKTPGTPFERFLELPLMEQASYHPAGDYYMVRCPVHGADHHPSLLVREDAEDGHVVLLCFAGCRRADICTAVGLSESDLYRHSSSPLKRKPAIDAGRALTIADLALDKRIHPRLLSVLQVEDGYTYRGERGTLKNVVKIPYFNEDGTPRPRNRVRSALTAKSGSFWDGLKTDRLVPYGLQRLQEAREAGYIWLPEGETDCWTFWLHGEPALGIPGATNTGVLQAAHLRDIPILYIVREPPTPWKQGDAGRSFVEGIQEKLEEIGYQGQVYVVDFKDAYDVKDPNELHVKLFLEGRISEFKSAIQRLMHEAAPLEIASPQRAKRTLAEMRSLIDDTLALKSYEAVYSLVSQIAELELKDQEILVSRIAVGTNKNQVPGFSRRSFNHLFKEAVTAHKRAQNVPQHSCITNRRDIVLTGDVGDDAEATLNALYVANASPVLFIRGAKLARCRISEEGRPFIEDVTPDILLFEMSRVARFFVFSQTKGMPVPAYPSASVARHILARGKWEFPALRGITEVPIIKDDGTILDTPGYDKQSRLLYIPQPGLTVPSVPTYPTQADVEEAREYVWQFFAEFCYESQPDAAHAFGALLTTVTRNMYPLCPMHLVDGVKPGTGKTLWVQALAYIASGRVVASSAVPQDETEWQKTLLSYVLAGTSFLSLDNIRGLLSSAQLEAFLTSPSWSGRILGTNQTPELIQRSLIVGSGNNLEIGGDLPRRCVRIRLTTGNSQPWMQTGFEFSPLLKHLQAHRGQIICALLTLVRSWIVAGKPVPASVPTLGTFDGWSETIGGILAHSGIPGFLENLTELYNETDSEGPQWTNFLETWEQTLGQRQMTAGELVEAMRLSHRILADALPDILVTDFHEESPSFPRSLGRALRHRRGTPYGANNTRLVCTEDKHKKQKVWSVTSSPDAGLKPRLWVISGTDATKPVPQEATVEYRPSGEEAEASASLPLPTIPEKDSALLSCQASGTDEESARNLWCDGHVASQEKLEDRGIQLHHLYPTHQRSQAEGDGRSASISKTAHEGHMKEAIAEAMKLANHQRYYPRRE
jgi:hypothetical protein